MQTSTFASAAAAAALVCATACVPIPVDLTGGEEERPETAPPAAESPSEPAPGPESPPDRPPAGQEGQGDQEGSDSGGSQEGQPQEPAGGAAVHLPLGGSHTFGDGFSVSMGPVERRTDEEEYREAPQEPEEETSPEEGTDPLEGGESPEDGAPPEEEWSPDEGESFENEPWEEEPLEEEPLEDEPLEEESPEEEFPEEELPEQPGEGPGEDEWAEEGVEEQEPLEEEPGYGEPQYDALHYFAWTVTLTNGTGAPVHTGSPLDTCAVGDPLQASFAPVMGDTIEPPYMLEPGRSASWDADCLITEGDVPLQWTLEFHGEDGTPLYPPLVFSGGVP
ncbi:MULTISPECIES: hypothetical protein [unclassified Nocardiopsis]|uniref:hypothetical protein n=1 Tax=Nocardiopsis TaxID=2013 RepID=UPI00387A8CAA